MRLENWPTLLNDFISSRMDTPFKWGVHDCTLFAADCAWAITGTDPAKEYRGTYASETSAARIIVESGGFRELVNQNMGQEINPKLAQRGDWVLIHQGDSLALAVCMGINFVAAGKEGLIFSPMKEAITAWRVN